MAKTVRILHHDNCFDGIASAAVFSRFYRGSIDPQARFEYQGLAHKAGRYIFESYFSGDENVIVDFKYSSSERLTWWFDHHESAFLSPEDEVHFRKDTSGQKFHDPTFRSCTKYIAHVSREVFDCSMADLEELIEWADIIDGAQFKDARTAVELKEPALQLMQVIEAVRDDELIQSIIHKLQTHSLHEVAAEPRVRSVFDELYKAHLQSIEILRDTMTCLGGVVEFDLSAREMEGHNKFIPYYLFPESVYTVGVSLGPTRSKVSVGTNPWTDVVKRHNLAKLCEQYGGGGHAVVAAISFKPDELDEARKAAREIAETLRDEP